MVVQRTIRLADLSEKTVSQKVLVCHQVSPHEVVRCAVELDATQIIQDSNPYFKAQLSSALEMLDHPGSFLEMPHSTILTPDRISAEQEKKLGFCELPFCQSSEKEQVLDAIDSALMKLDSPQSLLYDVKLVADELFTNALYNAPKALNADQAERGSPVSLPPGKTGRLVMAQDDGRLVLACEDEFGSLDIDRYISVLFKCYEVGIRAAINLGPGGAGIGCFMIFESCMSMILGVKPGHKTVVACVFALGKGARARQELSKSFHYIQA